MQGLVPVIALPLPLTLLPGPCLMCRLLGSALIQPACHHPTASDSAMAARVGQEKLQTGCRGSAGQTQGGLNLKIAKGLLGDCRGVAKKLCGGQQRGCGVVAAGLPGGAGRPQAGMQLPLALSGFELNKLEQSLLLQPGSMLTPVGCSLQDRPGCKP